MRTDTGDVDVHIIYTVSPSTSSSARPVLNAPVFASKAINVTSQEDSASAGSMYVYTINDDGSGGDSCFNCKHACLGLSIWVCAYNVQPHKQGRQSYTVFVRKQAALQLFFSHSFALSRAQRALLRLYSLLLVQDGMPRNTRVLLSILVHCIEAKSASPCH